MEGASRGEGLGNQFLSHIREVDAISHVVRCFEDENVTHVSAEIDPIADIETINLELILADLESVEKRIPKVEKLIKQKDKQATVEYEGLQKLKTAFDNQQPARKVDLSPEEEAAVQHLHLLTLKPVLYVANVAEEDVGAGDDHAHVQRVKEYAANEGAQVITISAKIEAEIVELEGEEKALFLEDLGIAESGLDQLIRAAFGLLDLATYFTAGEPEVRAWTFPRGMKAPQAAGLIHTDFERGFIRAEVVAYEDLMAAGSTTVAREQGKWRLEGKEYEVQDGDVVHFRFNV